MTGKHDYFKKNLHTQIHSVKIPRRKRRKFSVFSEGKKKKEQVKDTMDKTYSGKMIF